MFQYSDIFITIHITHRALGKTHSHRLGLVIWLQQSVGVNAQPGRGEICISSSNALTSQRANALILHLAATLHRLGVLQNVRS